MTGKVREQGERVRAFILKHVEHHGNDIAALAARKFDCSRQAVNKHIRRLIEEGAIEKSGNRRLPSYRLAQPPARLFQYPFRDRLAEDIIWTRDIRPQLEMLPGNVLSLWHYCFTEIVNNAIDHSGGTTLSIELRKTAVTTEIQVRDDGVGIFRKIQGELDLLDERQAIFELSKGKLTTDPANHSGQGIFFTSRMLDKFAILSGGLFLDHERGNAHDWLVEREQPRLGTSVIMELSNHTARTTRKVFDEYSSKDDEYSFNKTVVPVTLARFGPDELVSRSQAKRLLARVDQFKIVVFDFNGVESIGQAFADEIFRVFAKGHPDIEMPVVHATKQVRDMIARAHGTVRAILVATPGRR